MTDYFELKYKHPANTHKADGFYIFLPSKCEILSF